MPVSTIIDEDLCTGCGLCVRVCPLRTIAVRGEKAVIVGDRSLYCGHCAAVCPTGAIRVESISDEVSHFATFDLDDRWLRHAAFDTATLVRLMASRRSCRNYTDKPVDRDMLEDLVKIGVTAPSGTNSQKWTFTVLADREAVGSLATRIARFYERLNRLAEKSLLRTFLRFVGKPELNDYYHQYYDSVKEGLSEWKQTGRDRLFHGATAAIAIGSEPGASLPKEDSMLATQNILLGAHSMGLGTCLIGMAVEAMKHDQTIKASLGIPDREPIYSVIALGHPDETYRYVAGRKKMVVRHVHGAADTTSR